jgi:hypothetical protein
VLAALVSLRNFETGFDDDFPIKDDLSFIQKVSDRAPHLDHFALDPRCYKKVGGDWVICGLPGLFRSHIKGECAFVRLASTCCPG